MPRTNRSGASSARQLPLFSSIPPATTARVPSDARSAELLDAFRRVRLLEGAHRRSADREVSQMRAIAREAGTVGAPAPMTELLGDLSRVAQVLLEPKRPIARSTGRVRLLAAQRFIRIVGPAVGRDAAAGLATLDALLPSAAARGWHVTGTVVAGQPGRGRRGPTLDAADLDLIIEAAGAASSAELSTRDRALVALHCFSGLRPEEVVSLRWEDLGQEMTPSGFWGLIATVRRRGGHTRLLIPGRAASALQALAADTDQGVEVRSGPVFRARGRSERALSYRSARMIVHAACRRAGLPPVGSVDLRAAFAAWLRVQGLSDHEAADVLGLARVRSLDSLLRPHAALSAQRMVRETLLR